jgi:thiosulfate/3-mercaptopyruvate sulfurtransferase
MTYNVLIQPRELLPHLGDPNWVILDCRASLSSSDSVEKAYLENHIPGAVKVDLASDLSAPVVPGVTGRHPLPQPEQAARTFSRMGIGPGFQVVAYDDAGGALAAGRAWWMLRWLGFEDAAVLNGGWQAWLRQGLPLRSGSEVNPPGEFQARLRPELAITTEQVERLRSGRAYRLVDARSAERFRGENEQFDPVAGHIPGAINAPYMENLAPDGTFLSKDVLRQRYIALLGDVPADKVVFYCGSGVTAAHDILAMMAAGLGESRLYPGSWSEWITHPELARARG